MSANSLILQDGFNIFTIASGTGSAGNLEINTSEVLELSAIALNLSSSLQSRTFGAGSAGDLAITTGQLIIRDASSINAVSFGVGFGGNVTVNAESIEVDGSIPETGSISFIGAVTLGDGNAGNVTIETSKLAVRAGGRVNAATLAGGSAGNLIVSASESIEVVGVGSENPPLPSAIDATGTLAAEITRIPKFKIAARLPPAAGSPSPATGDCH